MNDPAVCTALMIRKATKPSANPAPTCRATAPISSGVPRLTGPMCLERLGVTATAKAAAMPTFTWTGIILLLNGGAIATHELARTRARKKATIAPGANSIVTPLSRRDQAGDEIEELMGERHELTEHPMSGHDDDERDPG